MMSSMAISPADPGPRNASNTACNDTIDNALHYSFQLVMHVYMYMALNNPGKIRK